MTWEQRAECRNHEPENWIPKRDKGRADKVKTAQRICSGRCPVQRDCADFAITTGQTFGVWGGVDLGDSTSKPTEQALKALHLAAKGLHR